METYWSITGIERANRDKGGHFFDADSKRFFNSRILSDVFQGPGGIYFVTSERFTTSRHTEPRYYTVRKFDPETGDVNTAPSHMEGFQAYPTARRAKAAARKLADAPDPQGEADADARLIYGRPWGKGRRANCLPPTPLKQRNKPHAQNFHAVFPIRLCGPSSRARLR